jgi:hypothetical protein
MPATVKGCLTVIRQAARNTASNVVVLISEMPFEDVIHNGIKPGQLYPNVR